MAGARQVFNNLFNTFQKTEFFVDALFPFSWTEETVTSLDRVTGESITETTTYSCNAFLVNPSKSERPSDSLFKDIRAGDIVVMAQQDELTLAPPLNSKVTFRGVEYTCKEVVPDVVGVSWKMLLRK